MPRNDLKAYTSLIARIPQDLADQVKRYASEHRCTISELIRDGLEMRLETDLPWHAPGDRRDAAPEVVPEVLHALEALTPMLRTLVQDTVRESLSEVLPEVLPSDGAVLHEALPYGDQVLHGHTSTLQVPSEPKNGGMTEVIPQEEVLPGHTSAGRGRAGKSGGMTEVLPFDTARYVLGKLCPRNHDYQGTGQSLLRRTNRHCCACDREKFHERKQAKRQAPAL
jgi:hypothetical protein